MGYLEVVSTFFTLNNQITPFVSKFIRDVYYIPHNICDNHYWRVSDIIFFKENINQNEWFRVNLRKKMEQAKGEFHFFLKLTRNHKFWLKMWYHFQISQENALLYTYPKKNNIKHFLNQPYIGIFMSLFGGLCFCVCVCVLDCDGLFWFDLILVCFLFV